jgi:Ca-activated chloride channel family protein
MVQVKLVQPNGLPPYGPFETYAVTRQLSSRIFAGAVAVLAVIPIAAQLKDSDPHETAIFRADTRLVVLHASVVDKSGHLLMDLPQKAFRVLENGVAQPIKKFLREDVPVSMGLILDSSGSMDTRRQEVEASALALVKASNTQDEVFIVSFNDEAVLEQPLTGDIKELERGLAKIDSIGGTAMRDAIRMSIDYLKENGKRDKKVLVVVTDGEDNNSSGTLEDLIKDAQQGEVLIYTVGLLSEDKKHEAKRATRVLNAIAEATGGKSYYAKRLEDVAGACQQAARDIRSQYIIEYSPTKAALDGSFRRIKVIANAPNQPIVRTRSGYYATPDIHSRAASMK